MACLFTASCVAELARELPAAGSVATYAARGLHPAVGFLVGWGYVFVEMLVPPLLLLQLGFTAAGTLHEEWASYPADLWWPWSLAGGVIAVMRLSRRPGLGPLRHRPRRLRDPRLPGVRGPAHRQGR